MMAALVQLRCRPNAGRESGEQPEGIADIRERVIRIFALNPPPI
jgi:hypothetical protein